MNKNIESLIRNILKEYKNPSDVYDYSGGIGASRTSSTLPSTGSLKSDKSLFQKSVSAVNSRQASSCVPKGYVTAISELKKSGANTLLLKATLGIIGRESDFGGGDSVMSKKWWSYNIKSAAKNLKVIYDKETSLGPGQITPLTAKSYGINPNDLNTVSTAVRAVYKILLSNYMLAKSVGYSTSKPSSNMTNGTGNAALDIAIGGHNIGTGRIVKYCETSNPKLKRNCSDAGKKVDGLSVYNKPVLNYLPNIITGNLTTHNYVAEVAKRIKSLSCVDSSWSGDMKGTTTTKTTTNSSVKSKWDGYKPGDLRYWKVLYAVISKSGLPISLDSSSNGKIENSKYFYSGSWIIWRDTNKNGGYFISNGKGTVNKSSVVGKIVSFGGKYSGEDINKTVVELKGGNKKRYTLKAFLQSKAVNLVYQNTRK
jgi:hypothetical protein